jgi:hypothetical protein
MWTQESHRKSLQLSERARMQAQFCSNRKVPLNTNLVVLSDHVAEFFSELGGTHLGNEIEDQMTSSCPLMALTYSAKVTRLYAACASDCQIILREWCAPGRSCAHFGPVTCRTFTYATIIQYLNGETLLIYAVGAEICILSRSTCLSLLVYARMSDRWYDCTVCVSQTAANNGNGLERERRVLAHYNAVWSSTCYV